MQRKINVQIFSYSHIDKLIWSLNNGAIAVLFSSFLRVGYKLNYIHMLSHKKSRGKLLALIVLSLVFAAGLLSIKIYPNQYAVTQTALAYQGQCSTSNDYSCPSGTTCSCPEWSFDWKNNQDAGDCDCVAVPTNQEACVHTICPVGYSCYDPGGGDATYCINSSGTPRPSQPPPPNTPTTSQTAQCLDVKAYTPAWVAHTTTTLQNLKPNDTVYFCARGSTNIGSFSKAQFTINGTLRPETTIARPGTVNEFCDLYTIPSSTYSFNVTAQIYHVTLGWIQ